MVASGVSPSDTLCNLGIDEPILGILAILVGFFMTFFGRRVLKGLIVAVGFFGAGAVAATCAPFILDILVLYLGFPQEHYENSQWGMAFVAAVIGAALAWYAWKIGCYLAGGLAGFVLSSWLVMILPQGTVEAYMSRNAFLTLFILLGCLCSILMEEYILMAASVIAGSSVFMFGLDKFSKFGFAEAIEELVNTKYDSLNAMSWNAKVMLACTAIIAKFGLIVQACADGKSWCCCFSSSSPPKKMTRTKSDCASCHH